MGRGFIAEDAKPDTQAQEAGNSTAVAEVAGWQPQVLSPAQLEQARIEKAETDDLFSCLETDATDDAQQNSSSKYGPSFHTHPDLKTGFTKHLDDCEAKKDVPKRRVDSEHSDISLAVV